MSQYLSGLDESPKDLKRKIRKTEEGTRRGVGEERTRRGPKLDLQELSVSKDRR